MAKKITYLLIVFFCTQSTLSASHLIGGSLGYEYLGQFGANYRYKVILTVYNSCDASSNVPLPRPGLDIGIYSQDIANNPMGGGNKTLIRTVNLNLTASNEVIPPFASNCAVGQSVCIFKGVYEETIEVPLNFNGYHLYFEDFARNNAIDNLINPASAGMAFHAYISPSLVNNSSPVFVDDPVPFLCVNDTASILNTAIDPDGDQLIFSFVEPMVGPNSTFAPLANPLPWPINPAGYNPSYSAAQPFGAGGFSFMDGATGLTRYMSRNTGNYVVAVEIREFRNGNLIGVSRRDLQLLVINCPPNPPPNLAATGGSGTTQYSVEECGSLNFPITITDPNGDSLTLSTQGQIFDPSFITPTATIDALVTGDSIVTTNFNWNTACGTSRSAPYLFTVSTVDNGCPPKATNIVYEITVTPPKSPDLIVGSSTVCQNSNQIYTVDSVAGYTYNWTVTNGTIISGQGSVNVNVNWPSVGIGSIAVQAFSACGCPATLVDTAITIIPAATADAGTDILIACGDTTQIGGSPTGPIGTTFSWSPTTNINNISNANPLVSPLLTTTYTVTVDNGTCTATDIIEVSVNNPIISTINDTSVCSGDCAQLNTTGGTSYAWTPSTGLSNANITNPIACPTSTTTYFVTENSVNGCGNTDSVTITVNNLPSINAGPDLWLCTGDSIQLNVNGALSYLWSPSPHLTNANIFNPTAFPLVTTNYTVIGTDANGCSNSDDLVVTVGNQIPINPGQDTSICEGDSVLLGGTPTAPTGSTYSWFPNGSLDNDALENPTAFPSITTTYYVVVTNDTCTSIDSVTVTINPSPTANAGNDVDLCIGDSVQLNATGGNIFSWSPKNNLTDSFIFNPIAFPVDTTEYILLVTDVNGCSTLDSITLNSNPLPIISAGSSPLNLCSGDSIQLNASGGVSYSWVPGNSLTDPLIFNPLAFPNVQTKYTVTGTDGNGCSNIDSVIININSLTIIDLSDTSICIGDSLQLTVNGPTGATYLWNPGTDLSNTTISNPFTSTQITTDYIVTVTDMNGCSDSTSITVVAEPNPTASFSQINTPICEGISVDFINSSSDASSYLWLFGDGNQSVEVSPTYIFPYGNSYNIFLTAYGAGTCADTVNISFNTLDFENYFNPIPATILTPNGDGFNDLFKIDLPSGVEGCTDIKVFNRWGLKVYDSFGQNSGWDGRTTAGIEVPVGTYFYTVDINGIVKKGSITLMR